MDQSIPLGTIPPVPCLDREEPELRVEDDIPTDDADDVAPQASGEEEGANRPEHE